MMTQIFRNSQKEHRLGIEDGHALLKLARGWLKQGNTVVAIELLNSAHISDEAEHDRELRAQIHKETGRARMMQSEWNYAESSYLEAQNLFLDNGDFKGASECARNRANMHFQKGEFKRAEKHCRIALEWAHKINDNELSATILNTLGAIESTTGRYSESLNTFRLCLAGFVSTGNLSRQGHAQLNIGLTQTELHEFEDAIKSLNQALAIAMEQKDQNLVEICYQNIAKCYLNQGEFILAKSVIDTARKILPGLNSIALEAELNLIDCKILRKMGNWAGAGELLDETYSISIDYGLSALTADVLHEMGLLARDKGNYNLASNRLESAIEHYELIGMENGRQEAREALNSLKEKDNG